MSRQECGELLARLGFGRVACARKNQPYIVPIYFTYNAGRLYGLAAMVQKIEWMRSNPLVCVEADDVRSRDEWSSVIVRGRYKEIPDTPKYAPMRRQVQTLLEKRSVWWQTAFAAAKTHRQFKQQVPVFFSIHIKQIAGLQASPDSAPVYIGQQLPVSYATANAFGVRSEALSPGDVTSITELRKFFC